MIIGRFGMGGYLSKRLVHFHRIGIWGKGALGQGVIRICLLSSFLFAGLSGMGGGQTPLGIFLRATKKGKRDKIVWRAASLCTRL